MDSASNLTGVSDAQAQLEKQWDSLVKSLSRYKGKRFFLGALLKACKAREINLDRLILKFGHPSHKERMEEELGDPQTRRALEESILKSVGTSYKVDLALTDDAVNGPTKPSAQSHLVRAALAMGARIIEEEGEQT